jgi:hypothetical protein
MSQWGSLNREIFSHLVRNTPDTRDLLQLCGTCRHLRALYLKLDWLCHAARYHLIRVHDVTLLPATMRVHSDMALMPLDVYSTYTYFVADMAMSALATLLWRKHYFNLFTFAHLCDYSDLPMSNYMYLRKILARAIVNVYNNIGWTYDSVGNVTCYSDHLGSGRWCRKRAHKLDYDIHSVEMYEWLATDIFPGTFAWRLIHFPEFKRHGNAMTQGTSVQIMFRADGTMPIADDALVEILRAAKVPTLDVDCMEVRVLNQMREYKQPRCFYFFFILNISS